MHPTPMIYRLPAEARRIWARLIIEQAQAQAQPAKPAEPQEIKP